MFERDCRWDGMRKMARLDTPWQTHHGTLQRVIKFRDCSARYEGSQTFCDCCGGSRFMCTPSVIKSRRTWSSNPLMRKMSRRIGIGLQQFNASTAELD